MIKLDNVVTPSPEQWLTAVLGMRNAFKVRDRSDSDICTNSEEEKEICYFDCPYVDHWEGEDPIVYPVCNYNTYDNGAVFVLGENDRDTLINKLCKAGDPSHRKVLRQLPVTFDITAPLYFFKQFDTYKVGTTANSESTMHTLTKHPFRPTDFSTDYLEKVDESEGVGTFQNMFEDATITDLNYLRDMYLETGNKDYWYALNQFLPQSYNQTRTWTGNYEVLITMINQRRTHKLDEWHTFIDMLFEEIPYLKEIWEAIEDDVKTRKELAKENEELRKELEKANNNESRNEE